MYQTIYHWASSHFWPVSIGIVLFLVLLEAAGIHKKPGKASAILWTCAFLGYLSAVLFLTLGSRTRIEQRYLNLKIHWEAILMALQGKGRLPWEDLANIILFLPLGIFFQEALGENWFCCCLLGAALSACIELTQWKLRCGYCDINDFLCNMIGTIVGYFFTGAVIRAQEADRKRRNS